MGDYNWVRLPGGCVGVVVTINSLFVSGFLTHVVVVFLCLFACYMLAGFSGTSGICTTLSTRQPVTSAVSIAFAESVVLSSPRTPRLSSSANLGADMVQTL